MGTVHIHTRNNHYTNNTLVCVVDPIASLKPNNPFDLKT